MAPLAHRCVCALLALAKPAALAAGAVAPIDIAAHAITDSMAAVYTPMTKDGLELDLDKIAMYAAYMAKIGVTNIMPAGSNGESLSLTVMERKRLIEAWAHAGPPQGLKIYAHIGTESLPDSRELAAHAASITGITGILAMAPVYFKPTLQTLHDFLAGIASAAPTTPFWFYHFPDDTGVLAGKAHEVLQMIDQSGAIPNFMGIKYTDYNLMDFQMCTKVGGGKYNMLYGRDEQALAAMELGAAAAVSSTVQFSPTLRETVAAFKAGNMTAAKVAQLRNAEMCEMFGNYDGATNVQKDIMRMTGMDVGPPRLPQHGLTATEFSELKGALIKGEFIDYAPTLSADIAV